MAEQPDLPPTSTRVSFLRRTMPALVHAMPASADDTNPAAVRVFRRVELVWDVFTVRTMQRLSQYLRDNRFGL